MKGLVSVSNALFQQVEAGNITATIHLLEKRGWNKDDSAYCLDPAHVLRVHRQKNRAEFKLIWQYLTTEERERWAALLALADDRKKTVGAKGQAHPDKGRERVRPDNQRRPGSKPARRRTGRPRWSGPDLEVITTLAAHGLTTRQIAQSLGVSKAT